MYFRSGNRVLRLSVFSFVLCLAFALASTACTNVCSASSASGGNIVFILDASGSMAAKVQGRVKIDAAKEVMTGLINNLPAGIRVGLVAYGHRQKKDCNDIEELSPLAPLNKQGLIGKIKGLTPKGQTPIAHSVQIVAEGLKSLGEEATIILVTDGEETCGGDPCSLVRELRASGIKFVMHVIGFDVVEKEKAQLICIAEAGGGSYFTAKNAGELLQAAQKAISKTEQSAGKLKVTALRNGKPIRAYCEINEPAGNEDEKPKQVDAGWLETAGTTFKLMPGVYDVKVTNQEDAGKPSIDFKGVSIDLGKNVEKVADFSGGNLKVKALRNGKPFKAYCEVYKPSAEENKAAERIDAGWTEAEGASFKLVPGVYDLKVTNQEDAGRPSVDFRAVSIEAGKSVEKVADFSGGTLKVKALRNGKPFKAYCEIFKPSAEEDKTAERVDAGWADVEGASFKLVPGIYDLKVTNHEDAGRPSVDFKGVSIDLGKSVEKVADFSGGTLKVKALRNGKPFKAYCEIYKPTEEEDKDSERVDAGWADVEGASFKLVPGIYDLKVTNHEDAGRPSVDFKGVSVEVGKSVEKVADFSGGTLKVKALRNGKPFKAYCEIYKPDEEEDKAGERVDAGWADVEGASFKLVPGIYDLKVTNHEDAGRPSVDIKGVSVEAAKSVEKVAEFSGGTLKIKALMNGKSVKAYCEVYKAAQSEDEEKERVDAGWIEAEGTSFKLVPGTYDLIVNRSDSDVKKEIKGVAVEAGTIHPVEAQF